MCIYCIKNESWGVLVRLGVSSGILGRPGVIRLTALKLSTLKRIGTVFFTERLAVRLRYLRDVISTTEQTSLVSVKDGFQSQNYISCA